MLFQKLKQFAQEHPSPFLYAPIKVSYLIELDPQGNLLSFTPATPTTTAVVNSEQEDKAQSETANLPATRKGPGQGQLQRPKQRSAQPARVSTVLLLPSFRRTNETRPMLLWDHAEYLFGMPSLPPPPVPSPSLPQQSQPLSVSAPEGDAVIVMLTALIRATARHKTFVELVSQCAKRTGLAEVKAVETFLRATDAAVKDWLAATFSQLEKAKTLTLSDGSEAVAGAGTTVAASQVEISDLAKSVINLDEWPWPFVLPTDFDPKGNISFKVAGVNPTDLVPVQQFWASLNAPVQAHLQQDADNFMDADSAAAEIEEETEQVTSGKGKGKGKATAKKQKQPLTRQPQQCLVCGQPKLVLERLQGNLKQVLGGQSSGTSLLSANKESFESYGMEASLVSPICSECGAEVVRGLNLLLSERATHRYDLGGVSFLFWLGRATTNDGNTPAATVQQDDAQTGELFLGLLKQWFSQPTPPTLEVLKSFVAESSRSSFSITPTPYSSTTPHAMDAPDAEDHYEKREDDGDGRQVHLDPQTPFNLLAINGNGSRAVVREWQEITVGQLLQNLIGWYERQLDLVLWSGAATTTTTTTTAITSSHSSVAPGGLITSSPLVADVGIAPSSTFVMSLYGLFALAGSFLRDPAKELQSDVAISLVWAVLMGRPLPRKLLTLALNRARIESDVNRPRAFVISEVLRSYANFSQPYHYNNSGEDADASADIGSSSSITTRNYNASPSHNYPNPLNNQKEERFIMSNESPAPAVSDPPVPVDVAKLCGQLLAVLERVQHLAQPGSEFSLANRAFANASMRPASEFGRLIRAIQPYLAALERRSRPQYIGMQRQIEELTKGIMETGRGRFPNQLSLEQQAQFSLGYYNQRSASRSRQVPLTSTPTMTTTTNPEPSSDADTDGTNEIGNDNQNSNSDSDFSEGRSEGE